MIFNKTGTPLEGHPKLVLLHEVEGELGNNLTLYGHAITRGGSKVSITPSPTPVVWLPNAPAIGGEGSGLGVEKFEAATLGQFLRSHEDTLTVPPKCKGLVRPVFEMKASQQTQGAYALMPSAPQGGVLCGCTRRRKLKSQLRVLCFWADGWVAMSFRQALMLPSLSVPPSF